MDLQRLDGGLSQHLQRHTITWGVWHPFLGLHKENIRSPPSNESLEFRNFVAGGAIYIAACASLVLA